MSSSIGKKILAGAGIISLFSLLGKVMGFVQKLVVANAFGTGMQADAYTFAYNSIIFAFCILPIKILAPVLPLFVERREKEGEEGAWRFVGSIGTLTIIVMGILMVGGLVGAPWLVGGLSSFKSEETTQLAVKLVRIMFPAVLFVGVFALITLVLNAYKNFILPAVGDALNKIVAIVVLIVAVRWLGIAALAVGFVAGTVLCLGLQLYALRDKLGQLRFGVNWQDPQLKTFFRMIPPVVVGILVAQSRTMLDYRFTSEMGAGYTASLNFARGITDAVTLVVPFAVGVVIYPFFSDMIAAENKEGFTNTLLGTLRLITFMFVPLSVLLAVLRVPFIQLAFQRGQFTMESVMLTSGPMLYFAAGLTFFALEIILMRFFFALKDTWTPAWVGLGCVGVHVALILWLRADMMHSSIAVATAVSKGVKVLILLALLKPLVTSLRFRENLAFLLQTMLAAALLGVTAYLVYAGLSGRFPAPEHGRKLLRAAWLGGEIGVASVAGFAVFAGAAFVMRIREVRFIADFLSGGLKRVAGKLA